MGRSRSFEKGRVIALLICLFIIVIVSFDITLVFVNSRTSMPAVRSVFYVPSEKSHLMRQQLSALEAMTVEEIGIIERENDLSGFCDNGVTNPQPFVPSEESLNELLGHRTLSIVPFFEVSYRLPTLQQILDTSLSTYDELLAILTPNPSYHITLMDLHSFKQWWLQADSERRQTFTTLLSRGQIQFNAGLWTTPNLSQLEVLDFISLLTAGRRWIYSVFNITVTTGIIMGDYRYPRGLLSLLHKSGLELVVLYHVGTNSPYFDKLNSYGPYYAHGGIDVKSGNFMEMDPNFYCYGPSESDCVVVVHAYSEESRLLSHLINVGCIATSSQKSLQRVWQEELHRWVATQLSSKHPNKQHLVILVNIASQQCSDLSQAFFNLHQLTQLPSPLHVITKMHTLTHYAQLTAREHGNLNVFADTRFPILWPKAGNPREYGPYSNHPLVKIYVRHAERQFREVETLHGLTHLRGNEDVSVIRTMDRIRQIIAFSKNRYYFGGMTNWPFYEGLLHGLEEAVTLMSLVMEHSFHVSPKISFSLDDPLFDVMKTVFDRSVDLGPTNKLVMIITNRQSFSRTQIMTIPLSDTDFCIYNNSGELLEFQFAPDFDSPALYSFEVTIPAGSSINILIRRCVPPKRSMSSWYHLNSTENDMKIGNPDFGLILSPSGKIEKVYIFGDQFRFTSELGYYISGDSRAARAGFRVVSIKVKGAGDKGQLDELSPNTYNLVHSPVSVILTDGPIYSEIRQELNNNAVLLTRVFKSINPLLRTCLQQIVLIDHVETPEEFILQASTGFYDFDATIDENAFGSFTSTKASAKSRFPVSKFIVKEGSLSDKKVRITAVTDRLHNGGSSLNAGAIAFLLRRTTKFADICDYPEPARNAWTKEADSNPPKSNFKTIPSGNILQLPANKDRYHRFFWMMGTSLDRDIENLMVEDNEAREIDRQTFWFHFQSVKKTEDFRYSANEVVENTVESFPILSCIQAMNDTTEIKEKSFLDTSAFPATIRIVSITRPFAKNPMILVRLSNVKDTRVGPNSEEIGTFSICNMFIGFSVQKMCEMDITGTTEIGTSNVFWKTVKREFQKCDSITIEPGSIRTFGIWLE